MLDNDNIVTAEASEVVQKIPTDEKDDHKCSLCVIVSIQHGHSIFGRKGWMLIRHIRRC